MAHIIAPYITAWSTEHDLPFRLVERPGLGIAYTDESSVDRDQNGVLWHRTLSRPRQGTPEFGTTHPLRQRRAMRRLLCQVCAGPADHNENGVLWLLKDHRGDWPGWPEGLFPVEVNDTIVAFEDPAIRWVRAVNLVRELRGCTVVPLGRQLFLRESRISK